MSISFSYVDGEHVLEAEQWVPRPVSEVFEFFSLETNLEILTPDILNFKVLGKSTEKIGEGTLIDYRLKIRGIPARWQTRIECWEPGVRFVDNQLRGPYALWHHTHTFEARTVNGVSGTFMRDRVRFRLPLGWLGNLVAGTFVKRDVRKIFEHRVATIERLFGSSSAAKTSRKP